MMMNEVIASARLTVRSSSSGANQSAMGTTTHRTRPMMVRHEVRARASASASSTLAGAATLANSACDCSIIRSSKNSGFSKTLIRYYLMYFVTLCVSSWIVSLLVQNLAPFLFSRAAHRRTRFGHGRKLAQPLVRPARVNDRARTVTLPGLRNDRIERAAPTAADDLDVFRRIRARRQRPEHVIRVRHINVIINDDHVTSEITAGVAVGRDHPGLTRVARITLLDRNNRQQARAARFVAPHAAHIGHARGFQFLPDHGRAREATHVIEFARRASRRRAQDDRIVAMIEPFDFHCRLRSGRACVIARPFTERPFIAQLVRRRLAFNDDLGVGRNRQARVFAFDDLDGKTLNAYDPVVFAHAIRHFKPARQIDQWVLPERNRDFAWLAPGKILLAHDAALLAGRDVEAERIFIVNHHSVGSEIDPALIGVARDVNRARADVTPAVKLVPLRRRKLPHVDVFAFGDILCHGAGLDDFRLDVFDVIDAAFERVNEIEPAVADLHMQRRGDAVDRVHAVRENTIALRVALDVVEEQRLALLAAMVAQLGNRADLDIPVGAVDGFQFSYLLNGCYPAS